MPVVKFFACLDLEQKSSFLDGHYLAISVTFYEFIWIDTKYYRGKKVFLRFNAL